jgi:hypothetical protein
MAPAQNQQELPPMSDRSEREASVDSVHGGEVKPVGDNSSPISAPSPATPLTETSTSSRPSKKRKQLHEHEDEHSDSDSDYEYFKILKGPSLRDPTEIPIITTNTAGERKLLWAKMDTGADVNIIAEKIVQRLGKSGDIQASTEDGFNVKEIGGNKIVVDRKIILSFWAGKKNRECQDVEFWIPSQENDTDTDGVHDVLLGWKELSRHHMVMIDPEFLNEAEEGLEVLAKRAEEECPERPTKAICLGVKSPQIKHSGSVRR